MINPRKHQVAIPHFLRKHKGPTPKLVSIDFVYLYITINQFKMKKTVCVLLFLGFLSVGCNTNPAYETNLATAQKTFELFQAENLEDQMALFSEELVYTPPTYGAQDMSKQEFKGLLKMYHLAFDDIVYTPEVWLPGTDKNGKLDGSVRTYGTWNSKDAATGNQTVPLRSYHFFNFNPQGEIIAQGDFFDATGLMNSVGSAPGWLQTAEGKIPGVNANPGNLKIYETFIQAHNDKDLEVIAQLAHESILVELPDGSKINGKKEFIGVLNGWFESSDPKWNPYFAYSMKVVGQEGEWVIAGHTLKDQPQGLDVLDLVDIYLLENKVRRVIVYRKEANPKS